MCSGPLPAVAALKGDGPGGVGGGGTGRGVRTDGDGPRGTGREYQTHAGDKGLVEGAVLLLDRECLVVIRRDHLTAVLQHAVDQHVDLSALQIVEVQPGALVEPHQVFHAKRWT